MHNNTDKKNKERVIQCRQQEKKNLGRSIVKHNEAGQVNHYVKGSSL